MQGRSVNVSKRYSKEGDAERRFKEIRVDNFEAVYGSPNGEMENEKNQLKLSTESTDNKRFSAASKAISQ